METLTSIQRYTTKKDGSPLVTSKGKPYTSVRIKTQERGDIMISGFGNQENASWKIGDKVEIIVEQKEEYWNFSMPRKTTTSEGAESRAMNAISLKIMPMLENLNSRLLKLENKDVQPDADFIPPGDDFGPF